MALGNNLDASHKNIPSNERSQTPKIQTMQFNLLKTLKQAKTNQVLEVTVWLPLEEKEGLLVGHSRGFRNW